MTSVANGDAHEEEEDLKNTTDNEQIVSSEDSKSSKDEAKNKTAKSKLKNTSEQQEENDQSCIELPPEPENEIKSATKQLDPSVEIPKENGINSTDSVEKIPSDTSAKILIEDESNKSSDNMEAAKVEEDCNKHSNEVMFMEVDEESNKNSDDIELIEISDAEKSNRDSDKNLDKDINNSMLEGESKEEDTLNDSTSNTLDKEDHDVENTPNINESKDKLDCTKEEPDKPDSSTLNKDDVLIDISEESCESNVNAVKENVNVIDISDDSSKFDSNDEKKEHIILDLKTKNTAATEAVDLSATGEKDVEMALVNGDKNGFVEPNPLEKLNEHLNSIGCEEVSKSSQNNSKNQPPKPGLKSDNQSSNKENKNILSHPHDRFKDSPDNFVFAELSNEETGFPEVFTGLVKIGRYISVKGDFTLRSTEALVESPSLISSYLLKEPDVFPPKEKDSKTESKDFFHSSAGEILIGIGLSRVNEWYHRDMVRVKKRQMKREGKRPQTEEELALHEKRYTEARKANNVYFCEYKVCKTCGFTSESSVVMEGHLLIPHLTPHKEYQCNFCDEINRDPNLMLQHMEKVHKKFGRIQPPVLMFECPYCSFESNSKVKLNNHLAKCQRYFDHGVNQAPPRDFEFPALTPKPITVAVVKAYEKSLGSMHKGRGRPKKHDDLISMSQVSPNVANSLTNYKSSTPLSDSLGVHQIMSPMQMSNLNIRPAHSNSMSQIRSSVPPMINTHNRIYQVMNSAGQVVPIVGNSQMTAAVNQFPFTSNIANSSKKLHNTGPFFNSTPPFITGLQQKSMSDLPKMTGPYPLPTAKQTSHPSSFTMNSNNLVVCEICDGYIKDLDQLRTHMQLIHKVKIHPKMLVSRPPLNCQKCQWRFFTDQGLERHLLGAHGLVTSNMQELANKSKDAGCCTICGRVYASKLVSHMNQTHKVTLKPAHLSYKCTVCSATFNLYRLFENHVYLVHSGAGKRSSEGGRSSPSKKQKNSDSEISGADGQLRGRKDKKQSKEREEIRICIECGDDVYSSNPDCKKCEKCLKSDELVQGTLNSKATKEELKRNKTLKKAAS